MPRVSTRLIPALLAFAALPATAEVPLDVIADTEIFIDGLFQADKNLFDSDRVQFKDDAEMRRAEVIFRGKHVSGLEILLGYDPKADKWLDASVKGRLTAFSTWRVGQFKQPNSLEELGSTRNNDFISKSMVTNTFGIARRLGAELATEGRNWTVTGTWFGRELTRNLARGSGFGARASWAPMLALDEAGNADFLHLGLSAVSQDTSADTLRLRARPGADLTPTTAQCRRGEEPHRRRRTNFVRVDVQRAISKWSADYNLASGHRQQAQLPVDRFRRRHRPDQGEAPSTSAPRTSRCPSRKSWHRCAHRMLHGLVQFPSVIGGVVPVVNVPGLQPGRSSSPARCSPTSSSARSPTGTTTPSPP
jgi:hypothetical protein